MQLLISISFSISTGDDLTIHGITLPCHNAIIRSVSDINGLIIIDKHTAWITKLI
jgi:hypothetical protein